MAGTALTSSGRTRRHLLKTCEQCGADAVDARGICRNCGWRSRESMFDGADDTPSLGETRAADIPPGGYAAASPSSQPSRNARMNPYPTEARPMSPVGGATSGGRFCGTCGARLESGMAFCGQCGTPVAASTAGGMTFGSSGLRPTSQEPYHAGGGPTDGGNELTEEMPGPPAPAYNNFGRSGVMGTSVPYGGGTPFHSTGYAPATTRSSNATRLIVGVLCLVASIITATAAIILALTMNP